MTRYIVQVPALVQYAGHSAAAWADCLPVEGHRDYMAAYDQAERLTGHWRIVKVGPGREHKVILSSKEGVR